MSPELFDPEAFGLQDNRPTKHSDCYAFGMVIYEVLSGQAPFSQYKKHLVVARVLGGERPRRPQGMEGIWFTDDIWKIVERCWRPIPDDRPGIGDVLQCLEMVSGTWTPPQMLAGPPTANLPTHNAGWGGEGTTDEGELYPALDLSEGALACLTSGATSQGELAPFIEAIFSGSGATDMFGYLRDNYLRDNDAQSFVNIISWVRLSSSTPGSWLLNIAADLSNLNRICRTSTLRQKSEGNAWSCCTRHALATL